MSSITSKLGCLLVAFWLVIIIGCYRGVTEEYMSTSSAAPVNPVPVKPGAAEQFINPVEGYLMSGYGWRSDPISGRKTWHSGIDVSYWIPNMEVKAVAGGTVEFSNSKNQYGITVLIRHNDRLETMYCHLKLALIGVGEQVQQGETIGIMGNTGKTTGVHLHFEVRLDGNPVNPLDYLNGY